PATLTQSFDSRYRDFSHGALPAILKPSPSRSPRPTLASGDTCADAADSGSLTGLFRRRLRVGLGGADGSVSGSLFTAPSVFVFARNGNPFFRPSCLRTAGARPYGAAHQFQRW